MLSKREVTLLIMLLILVNIVVYYFFFFIPTWEKLNIAAESVAHKTADIEDARIREMQYGGLLTRRNEMLAEYEKYALTLPENFDQADVLNRMQQIIYPHTRNIQVTFNDTAREREGTEIHSALLNFSVTMVSLERILEDFKEQDIETHVVSYSLTRIEDAEQVRQHVSMTVDFLVRK